MLKRRAKEGTSADGAISSPPLCDWSKKFPTVTEFLTLLRWEDGASRESGTVTLMYDDGMAKAAMNDRDGELSCFVSGKTFTALFHAMEKGLVEDSLEWRKKRPYQTPRRK